MYKFKNKSLLIFLSGIVSYLYLFSCLLNNKYNIIFIYFTILFVGYFIIGNNIFLYNLLIIIFDILNKKFLLREGNFDKKYENGKQKAKSNKNFNKEGANSDKIDGLDEDESNDLTDKMDEKYQDNEKKKEASKVKLNDDGTKK